MACWRSLIDYINKGCLHCPYVIEDDAGIMCKLGNDPVTCPMEVKTDDEEETP